MTKTNSTDDYRFGYSDEEFERLGDQHRVWAADNQRLLRHASFGVGDTVVDLGCGPGFTTLDLARVVGPGGRVVAVDRDGDRSLPCVEQQAARAGLSNIEVRAAELETFDLPEGSVDGVYGRWVLMYLAEPAAEALVGRIAQWLRPGGVCALAELCNYRHMHIYPPSEHLPAIAEALYQAVASDRSGGLGGRSDRGCNPEIGNALPGLLHRAGLKVELNVSTKAVRATTAQWSWPEAIVSYLPNLVDEGHLARSALEAFMADWHERSRQPDAVFFGSPTMEVVARRSL